MKNKLILLFIFIGIVAQFALFSAVIIRREATLRYGEVCRFETAPVDPFDAFRGQYVHLDFKAFNSGIITDRPFTRKTWCYLSLATDTNGYSIVSGVTDSKPTSGTYIRTRVSWCTEHYVAKPKPDDKYHREPTGKWEVHLNVPFSRYYMPEKLAPQAETAYRSANRRNPGTDSSAAARVRVWKGMVVIEDIEINGKPIRAYMEAEKELKP